VSESLLQPCLRATKQYCLFDPPAASISGHSSILSASDLTFPVPTKGRKSLIFLHFLCFVPSLHPRRVVFNSSGFGPKYSSALDAKKEQEFTAAFTLKQCRKSFTV